MRRKRSKDWIQQEDRSKLTKMVKVSDETHSMISQLSDYLHLRKYEVVDRFIREAFLPRKDAIQARLNLLKELSKPPE